MSHLPMLISQPFLRSCFILSSYATQDTNIIQRQYRRSYKIFLEIWLTLFRKHVSSLMVYQKQKKINMNGISMRIVIGI